jgi:tRNASer (uridine44-2'-O)-methyltransferase
MAVARPTFNPSRCNAATDVDALRLGGDEDEDVTWTPLITCPADFPIELVCSFDRCVACCPAH